MNTNIVKWGTAVILVIFVFLWVTVYMERPTKIEDTSVASSTPQAMEAETNPVYETGKYKLSYPRGYTVSTTTEGVFANGVSFLIDPSLVRGTNLSADTRIYIEEKTGSSTCAELTARKEQPAAHGSMEETMQFGNNTYRAITYTEGAAGNFYETDVYAISEGGICYEISRVLHTTNIQAYEPGTITAFDRSILDKAIRIVLESFEIK